MGSFGFQYVVQPGCQALAGLQAVPVDQLHGAIGLSGADGSCDVLVFVPHRLAPARGLQHRAHHPAQVGPMQLRTRPDERIAAGRVDRDVKNHVGLDHGLDVVAAGGPPALLDQRRIDLGLPFRGQPRRQCVERAAHLVHVDDPAHAQRRYQQAAAGCVEHEAVFFQQPQRLHDGLP